jgi:AraC-like DNA-binding protein
MISRKLHRIKTISEFHQFRQLVEPDHPLISIINLEHLKHLHIDDDTTLTFDFYWIALKRSSSVKARYGQQLYDFNKGILSFMSPNQIFAIEVNDKNERPEKSGWALLIHPDFIWNTPLARRIKQYDFFDYAVNEALFLSAKEEKTLNGVIENIQQEVHSNIDKFSKQIIISHLEALLNYSDRFYNRQFLTRERANHQILETLEKVLTDYFHGDDLTSKGLPTVQYVAGRLNVSPSYLGSLLRVLTGQNTQQHIHHKLIEKAKEKLSTTNLSISEIAYELGFEHSQSFSKLFKSKVNLSPLGFRQSFN